MSDESVETLGGYTLLERIGKGGMGEVWRAERVTGGSVRRRAAVKRILPEYQRDATLRDRFTAEARITARLEHPNVVQVLDFGDTPELYLVLEYVDGVSVAELLRRAAKLPGKLPIAAMLHIVAEAATGLDYAHRRTDESGQPLGIVHRDVSPGNVMVSVDGAVKVNDFGIARAADNIVRTQAGMAIGKLVYMAPEQAGGEPVDRRADVFALGIVLWELLTLKPLLPRGDPARTLEALSRCEFPPPSSLAPGVPPEVDAIVREAMMRNVEQRTPSAARLSKSLRMVLSTMAPGFEGRDLARALLALMPELAARASSVSFTVAMPQVELPGARTNAMTQQSVRMDTSIVSASGALTANVQAPGHGPTRVEAVRADLAENTGFSASRRLVTSPHAQPPLNSPANSREPAVSLTPSAPSRTSSAGAPTTRPNMPAMSIEPGTQWHSPSGAGQPATFAPPSAPHRRPAGRGVVFGLVALVALLLVVIAGGIALVAFGDVNDIARRVRAAPFLHAAAEAAPTTAGLPLTMCARLRACCEACANLPSLAGMNQSCAWTPPMIQTGNEAACATVLTSARPHIEGIAETPRVCLEQSPPATAIVAASHVPGPVCTQLRACCAAVRNAPALVGARVACDAVAGYPETAEEIPCTGWMSSITSSMSQMTGTASIPAACAPGAAATAIAPIENAPSPAAGATSCDELAACCTFVPTTPALSQWIDTCSRVGTLQGMGVQGESMCRNMIGQIRSLHSSAPGIPPQCH